jgi:LPS-assembly protein
MATTALAHSALAAGPALAQEADALFVGERPPAPGLLAKPFATARLEQATQPLETGAPTPTVRAAAMAQPETPTDPLDVGERTPAEAAPPDPAGPDRILFEADTVTRETSTSPIVAEGNVRAFFGDRFLTADKLSWDQATDVVIAEGRVAITDKSLETVFAGRVELTGDLRDGIAENFSALLKENSRLAADSAVREQGARTRLRRAVYTACDVCDDDGDSKTPTWRIKSLRVTRDEERKVIRFYHSFLELKGVPIVYAPFLQAPDPSVERQSGFLTPQLGVSKRLGFNVEVPYYLAISDHQDATLYPRYTSSDGILWQGEYRRRDDSGYHVLQGSYIGFKPGPLDADLPGKRWHIFAQGYRDFGEKLRLGYDLERVSDDTYLRRYDILRRGDLRKELDNSLTNRLRTNTYAQWRGENTEIRADSFVFQDLRTVTTCDLPTGERIGVSAPDCAGLIALDPLVRQGPAIAQLTPYALPLLDFKHRFKPEEIGGEATINVNFASLQRTSGVDTRRLTASALWERERITQGGHRFKAFTELRGDFWRYEDLNEGTENRAGVADDNRFDARFAPSVGAEWSYPLSRRLGSARLFIEPRVQVVASPANRNQADIINEDSQSIEFDYAGLFDFNKSTGFDAFEDGQRINMGLALSAVFDNGIAIEGEVGQQRRLQDTNAFDISTGLGDKSSDYVGGLNIRYKDAIVIENRFRVDEDTGSVKRIESLAIVNWWKFGGAVNYTRLDDEVTLLGLNDREELNGTMYFKATDNWFTGLGWREDLITNNTVQQSFILGYQDECATIQLTYQRNLTQDVGLETDTAFLIRFTLRGLVE